MKYLLTFTETYEYILEADSLEEAQKEAEETDVDKMDYLSCSTDVWPIEESV